MSITHDERREFYRMAVDCCVEFYPPETEKKCIGEGKNLSATGVKFLTECELAQGQQLDVAIHPTDSKVKPLNVNAQVIRSELDSESGKYIVALLFSQVE